MHPDAGAGALRLLRFCLSPYIRLKAVLAAPADPARRSRASLANAAIERVPGAQAPG